MGQYNLTIFLSSDFPCLISRHLSRRGRIRTVLRIWLSVGRFKSICIRHNLATPGKRNILCTNITYKIHLPPDARQPPTHNYSIYGFAKGNTYREGPKAILVTEMDSHFKPDAVRKARLNQNCLFKRRRNVESAERHLVAGVLNDYHFSLDFVY